MCKRIIDVHMRATNGTNKGGQTSRWEREIDQQTLQVSGFLVSVFLISAVSMLWMGHGQRDI